MDPVDDILTTLNVENSWYVHVNAKAPWGITFDTAVQARLVIVARGTCWLTSDTIPEPQRLNAGDCFIVQADTEFSLQDELGRRTVHCDRVFADSVGHTAEWGGDGQATEIISGRFSFDEVAAEPLFAILPPVLQLSLDDATAKVLRATLELIALESLEAGIGSNLVTSRLADVLFVQALRAWCNSDGGGNIGWLAALRDPQLASAMQALHSDLSRSWTVAGLAREAGLSRSAFAVAFKSKTGQTPLDYLASWRMYRAKTYLRDSQLSLLEIAVRVGYDTDTALSRAFRRREGVAPGTWRKRAQRPSNTRTPGGVTRESALHVKARV
jgi:AraC-like DNA-binding protein/uncharacterized protein YaiE (UPF0345 family)